MHLSRFLWVALLAAAPLTSACAENDDEELAMEDIASDSELPISIEQGLDAEERALLALINDHRASAGAAPLQVSVTLSRAADLHSVDMATNNYFSHTSQDGKSPFTRMCDAGYCFSTSKAENIAAGNETAAATFTQWKNSSGHNTNMLSTSYKVIGIGRAFDASSTFGWYWTNTFGGQVDEVMSSGDTSAPPPDSPPSGGTAPPSGGASEAEPNDSFSTPNPVDGTLAGSLTTGDQDWFTWSVPGANVAYRVELSAQGDAEIRMWKLVDGAYYRIANTSPTRFANTSNGPGQYLVVVFSPASQQQPYSLTVQK